MLVKMTWEVSGLCALVVHTVNRHPMELTPLLSIGQSWFLRIRKRQNKYKENYIPLVSSISIVSSRIAMIFLKG